MSSKILLKVSSKDDFNKYNGDYDGVYFSSPSLFICQTPNEEVFVDLTELSPTDGLEISKKAPNNATFVVDDVIKAVFIKSFFFWAMPHGM